MIRILSLIKKVSVSVLVLFFVFANPVISLASGDAEISAISPGSGINSEENYTYKLSQSNDNYNIWTVHKTN